MLFTLLNTTACASYGCYDIEAGPNMVELVNDCGNILRVDLNATIETILDTLQEHQAQHPNQRKLFDLVEYKTCKDNNVSHAENDDIPRQLKILINDQSIVYDRIYRLSQKKNVSNFAVYANTLYQFERTLSSMGIHILTWDCVCVKKLKKNYKPKTKRIHYCSYFTD